MSEQAPPPAATGTPPPAAQAAPSPSLTTPPEGAAPIAAPQNVAGGTSTPPPGNAVAEIKFPDNWKQGLPKEFQDDPALKVVHDIPSLAKGYLHAQKMIGADKIVIPSKHATDEDWNAVYQKLGLPQELKDYAVKTPEGTDYNPQFIEKFKEFAHKSGVMPKQAEGLLSWYSQTLKSQNEEILTSQKQANATEWDGLKKQWGAAFDNNVLEAQMAFKTFADEETTKFLNESGLATNPKLVALFAKIGAATKEDTLQPPGKRTNIAAPLDPAAAKQEIGKIMSDSSHPYFNKQHANHQAAVAEVSRLNEFAFPQPQKS